MISGMYSVCCSAKWCEYYPKFVWALFVIIMQDCLKIYEIGDKNVFVVIITFDNHLDLLS